MRKEIAQQRKEIRMQNIECCSWSQGMPMTARNVSNSDTSSTYSKHELLLGD